MKYSKSMHNYIYLRQSNGDTYRLPHHPLSTLSQLSCLLPNPNCTLICNGQQVTSYHHIPPNAILHIRQQPSNQAHADMIYIQYNDQLCPLEVNSIHTMTVMEVKQIVKQQLIPYLAVSLPEITLVFQSRSLSDHSQPLRHYGVAHADILTLLVDMHSLVAISYATDEPDAVQKTVHKHMYLRALRRNSDLAEYTEKGNERENKNGNGNENANDNKNGNGSDNLNGNGSDNKNENKGKNINKPIFYSQPLDKQTADRLNNKRGGHEEEDCINLTNTGNMVHNMKYNITSNMADNMGQYFHNTFESENDGEGFKFHNPYNGDAEADNDVDIFKPYLTMGHLNNVNNKRDFDNIEDAFHSEDFIMCESENYEDFLAKNSTNKMMGGNMMGGNMMGKNISNSTMAGSNNLTKQCQYIREEGEEDGK